PLLAAAAGFHADGLGDGRYRVAQPTRLGGLGLAYLDVLADEGAGGIPLNTGRAVDGADHQQPTSGWGRLEHHGTVTVAVPPLENCELMHTVPLLMVAPMDADPENENTAEPPPAVQS